MNIQLIGTGDIANSFYAPSLKKLQEEGLVDEVQVYDINKEKAEAFALVDAVVVQRRLQEVADKRHGSPSFFLSPPNSF